MPDTLQYNENLCYKLVKKKIGYVVENTHAGNQNVTDFFGKRFQADWPEGTHFVLIKSVGVKLVDFANNYYKTKKREAPVAQAIEDLSQAVTEAHNDVVTAACKFCMNNCDGATLKGAVENYLWHKTAYNENTQKICYWPDGEWCRFEEVEEYTQQGSGHAKSDDYTSFDMDMSADDEDIQDAVFTRVNEDVLITTY